MLLACVTLAGVIGAAGTVHQAGIRRLADGGAEGTSRVAPLMSGATDPALDVWLRALELPRWGSVGTALRVGDVREGVELGRVVMGEVGRAW